MSTVIPEILAFGPRSKKEYTQDMHLKQLKRNRELMLQKLSELKGGDFDRCKWTINNYTKQIKELEEIMHSVIKIAECSGFDDLIYSAERNARTQEQREFVRKLLKKYHFWGDKMLIKFCDYKTLQSIVEP